MRCPVCEEEKVIGSYDWDKEEATMSFQYVCPKCEGESYINTDVQYYKDVPLKQIERTDYLEKKERRFSLNGSNQSVWIPNQFLELDGTIKEDVNIDFVFFKSERKFELAGILELYKPFRRPN